VAAPQDQVATDLAQVEGTPGPAADHAYIHQKSDLRVQMSEREIAVRATSTGLAYSPVNMAIAFLIGMAPAAGAAWIIRTLGGSALAAGTVLTTIWAINATGIFIAMFLVAKVHRG
jgi:hypothetical protein